MDCKCWVCLCRQHSPQRMCVRDFYCLTITGLLQRHRPTRNVCLVTWRCRAGRVLTTKKGKSPMPCANDGESFAACPATPTTTWSALLLPTAIRHHRQPHLPPPPPSQTPSLHLPLPHLPPPSHPLPAMIRWVIPSIDIALLKPQQRSLADKYTRCHPTGLSSLLQSHGTVVVL